MRFVNSVNRNEFVNRNDFESKEHDPMIGQMESINVAGVLQEAGDADSRAHIRSQV